MALPWDKSCLKMELSEFLNKMESAYQELPQLMLNNMDVAALDSKALIQQRIQEQGVDADGKEFRDYTKKYKKKKEKAGKYRGVVDFTYTTDMWSSISIIESKILPDQVKVRIGGVDEPNRLKMQGLAFGQPERGIKGRGYFLELANDELDLVREGVGERFTDDIKRLIS